MSVVELVNVLREIADRRVGEFFVPACYGTVTSVVEEGGVVKDVTLCVDTLKLELSWARGDFVIPDNLVLQTNDRVVVLALGFGAGVEFCVVARLSQDPGKAVVGNPVGAVRVARAGDLVAVPAHSHTVVVSGETGSGGDPAHTHSINITVESSSLALTAQIVAELAARLVVSG